MRWSITNRYHGVRGVGGFIDVKHKNWTGVTCKHYLKLQILVIYINVDKHIQIK